MKMRAATIATWETVIIKIRARTILIEMSKAKESSPNDSDVC